MANPSPKRKPLTEAARLKGAATGRATRVTRADEWAWSIITASAKLGRIRKVWVRELTNDEIARYLSEEPFNIRSSRGGALSGKAVHKAFTRVGIDRVLIKGWRARASKFADHSDVDPQLMMFQLWQEWHWHKLANHYLYGQVPGGEPIRPFVFDPIHPDQWITPRGRYAVGPNGPRRPPPEMEDVLLPTVLLVLLMMDTLDPAGEDAAELAAREEGAEIRQKEAIAAGESPAPHFDDAPVFGRYLDGRTGSHGDGRVYS